MLRWWGGGKAPAALDVPHLNSCQQPYYRLQLTPLPVFRSFSLVFGLLGAGIYNLPCPPPLRPLLPPPPPPRRPLNNMAEYAGIDAERVASMEERLKRDVLAEVGAGVGGGGGGVFGGGHACVFVCGVGGWGC